MERVSLRDGDDDDLDFMGYCTEEGSNTTDLEEAQAECFDFDHVVRAWKDLSFQQRL
jgi:hypothetical protein